MKSVIEDGGISSRMTYAIEAQIFRQYGFEELAKMSEEKANQHTHTYTCLVAPPELEAVGLTHMVSRLDLPERPVCAFNSSAAASKMCDNLNDFAKQDRPELLGEDEATKEIREANRLAEEREVAAAIAEKLEAAKSRESAAKVESEKTLAEQPRVIELSLSDKLAAAQAALGTK